jgi:Hypothetical protein FLILHELTA
MLIAPSFRHISSKPPSSPPPIRPSSQPPLSKSSQKFDKVFNRTPKFLRNWIQPIANQPLSHITSFLILHEVCPCDLLTLTRKITAVVPLIGLMYIFHKVQWTPSVLPAEFLHQGVEKGTKLIRYYGLEVDGDQFVRLAFDFAAAYASVKVSPLFERY